MLSHTMEQQLNQIGVNQMSSDHFKKDKNGKHRIKLSDVRPGLTRRVDACGFTYYLTVNFVDVSPVEVFITIAKEGSSVSGFIETLAITISIALQHGTPWETLCDKFSNQTFEPRDDKNSSLIHSISEEISKLVRLWEQQHNEA